MREKYENELEEKIEEVENMRRKIMTILVCVVMIATVFAVAGNVSADVTPVPLGGLYAGTYGGHVYNYLGDSTWELISPQLDDVVYDLVEYNGNLYAATGGNPGRVFRYDGINDYGEHVWTMVGDNMLYNIYSLAVYKGELYAGGGSPFVLYKYNGGTSWTEVVRYTSWSGIWCMYASEADNLLYLGDVGYDRIAPWDGEKILYYKHLGGSCIYDFMEYEDYLYAAAWAGRLWRSPNPSDVNSWYTVIDYQSTHMWELEIYQDYLYMGLHNGILQTWDGSTKSNVWNAPAGIHSMATDGNLLYVGTSDSGRVYSWDGSNAQLVSDDMDYRTQILYYIELEEYVTVGIEPSNIVVEPGDTATYTVTVTNIGENSDTYTLTVENSPVEGWATLSTTTVSLDPDESIDVTLTVTPPYDWLVMEDTTYSFRVRATSTTDSDITAYGRASITALALYKVEVGIDPYNIEVKPGDTAAYIMTVTNIGLRDDTYTLTVEDSEVEGWATLSDTMVSLAVGESTDVTLSVSPPYDWASMEDVTYAFTVRATSTTHPVIADTAEATITVIATKYSMALYINVQLDALIAFVEDPSPHPDIDAGVKASLLSELENAKMKKEQALVYIEQGKEKLANNMLNACEKILEAFVYEVEAQTAPPEAVTLYTDGRSGYHGWWRPPLEGEEIIIRPGYWYFRISGYAYYETGDPVTPMVSVENAEITVKILKTRYQWTISTWIQDPYTYYNTGRIRVPSDLSGEYTIETTLKVGGRPLATTEVTLYLRGYSSDRAWVTEPIPGDGHINMVLADLLIEQAMDIKENLATAIATPIDC